MKNLFCRIGLFTILLVLSCFLKTFAQAGAIVTHDPGAILKEGDKYWRFATGEGIHVAYSDDLFYWENAAKTVFPVGTWPEWINSAVPGFEGHFWAPEAFYMNGRYYVYYSASTFGSSRSAIGVATSLTLDPDSPDYGWTDLGMVVSSSVWTDVNAIDPAIFQDDDGRVYMSYGSFFGGMGIVELDPETGKRKSGAAIHVIAGGGHADWEAPYVFKENGYYYLIVNRGKCCNGINSTYRMVMGRSEKIAGPYIDKNGVSLRNEGGTHLLGTTGRYIGPGHFGLFREDGINYVSMHYYDRNDNGVPKLDMANLQFDEDGWPVISRDWMGEGIYTVSNQNSGLAWNSKGCTGEAGESLTQEEIIGGECQQWLVSPVGNGVYTIKSVINGKALGLAPGSTPGSCNTEWGAKLQLVDPLDVDCQKFRVGRSVDGAYIFTSLANNQAIEVPFASVDAGIELGVWGHNDCTCQRWFAEPVEYKVANVSPSDKAIFESPQEVTLEWEGAADTYKVYVGSSVENLELQAEGISETSFTVPEITAPGEYFWRVDAVKSGFESQGDVWSFIMSEPTAIADYLKTVTDKGHLRIYPQPVGDSATIEFALPAGGGYRMMLYDRNGKLVRNLEKGTLAAQATGQFVFSSAGLAPGLYRLQLVTDKETRGLSILIR